MYLAKYYQQDKKALLYANKAYEIANQLNNSNYKLEALSYILLLDKNPKIKEYKKLADSIAVAKQTSENKFASMKYDFSEEKRKAEEAKLKLIESQLAEEKQKQLKLLYLISTLFILFMAILLYFILRSRHKKEELLQVYKTETRISVKVHDEVANDVYHIITKLQDNATINEDVLDDLEKVYNKTRDISRENSTINLEANFNEIVNDLLVSYKNNEINIITKNSAKINWKRVSKEKKTIIYRVLQELMTNMKKHSKASLVVVTFTQENKLVIKYSDNGIGTENKTHNGLQNAENRINSVNGTISFDSHSGKGFKATITI
jgi:signal transduction histidine kinase